MNAMVKTHHKSQSFKVHLSFRSNEIVQSIGKTKSMNISRYSEQISGRRTTEKQTDLNLLIT